MDFKQAMFEVQSGEKVYRDIKPDKYFFWDNSLGFCKNCIVMEHKGKISNAVEELCMHDFLAEDWEVLHERKKLFITIKHEGVDRIAHDVIDAAIIGSAKKIVAFDDNHNILWQHINK